MTHQHPLPDARANDAQAQPRRAERGNGPRSGGVSWSGLSCGRPRMVWVRDESRVDSGDCNELMKELFARIHCPRSTPLGNDIGGERGICFEAEGDFELLYYCSAGMNSRTPRAQRRHYPSRDWMDQHVSQHSHKICCLEWIRADVHNRLTENPEQHVVLLQRVVLFPRPQPLLADRVEYLSLCFR